jgi:hypothetical protein
MSQSKSIEAFHGTTHQFKKFDIDKANRESHLGAGVYLTSVVSDAEQNYAGMGPDLTNRVEHLADQMVNEADADWNTEYQKFKDIARQELVGNGRYILTCKISPKAKLFPLGNRYLELWNYNADDEDAEPEYTEFGQAILDIYNRYDLSTDDLFCDGCIRTGQLHKDLLEKYIDYDDTNAGELFKQIILDSGYDGVEYEDAYDFFPKMVDRGTKHYVLYKPEFVKISNKERLDA